MWRRCLHASPESLHFKHQMELSHRSWVRANNFGHKLKNIHPFTACLEATACRFPYRAEMVYDLLQREALVKLAELRTALLE